ncbi:hypothetical protein J1N35_042023 [Gossypium stocksii]|uniref:Uncharacterized protein n=1 Tax=Gossypium stocksii TaxID=47602 RepID=A0A9D3UGV7_9ROSI|nr:hypothetical protein J1N35_042023 [Gossypium stocksii]
MIGTNQLGVLPSKAPTTPITTKATLASHHNNHRHPHRRLPYKAAANSGSTTPIAKAKADAATACTGLVLKCLLFKLAETVVDFVLCFLRIVSVSAPGVVINGLLLQWVCLNLMLIERHIGNRGLLVVMEFYVTTGEILALFSGLLGSLDSNEAELRSIIKALIADGYRF